MHSRRDRSTARRPWRARRPRALARLVAVTASLVVLAGCGGGSHPNGGASAPLSPTAVAGSDTSVRPLPGFVPASASFPSARVGFAWGVSPCPRTDAFCGGLAGTTDGGKTWHALTAPAGLPANPYRTAVLRFANPLDGWAALGSLQATHDGGRSWAAVHLDGLADPSVSAVATAGGYVFVVATDARTMGAALRLYVSPIADNRFTAVPGIKLPSLASRVDLSFDPTGARGYLAVSSLGAAPLLLRSRGATGWQQLPVPCAAGSNLAVGAGSGAEVTVLCDTPTSATTSVKTVWTSTDAGSHFVQQGMPGPAGYTTDVAQAPDQAMPEGLFSPRSTPAASSSASAPSTSAARLVVAASAREDRLYLTDNGGQSWKIAYANSSDGSGSGLGLSDLAFSDPTHGSVVLGNTGLYVRDRLAGRHLVPGPRLLLTQDGGAHWSQSVVAE
ncbi:MAG TPA: hypothetical protein VHC41_03135 [Mycobacteriales bacterium]|jgi:photosystem II stability/assembly factor-like uncharacterized protein|nr:hypothetical protein [Mycobacteriales bacterium]